MKQTRLLTALLLLSSMTALSQDDLDCSGLKSPSAVAVRILEAGLGQLSRLHISENVIADTLRSARAGSVFSTAPIRGGDTPFRWMVVFPGPIDEKPNGLILKFRRPQEQSQSVVEIGEVKRSTPQVEFQYFSELARLHKTQPKRLTFILGAVPDDLKKFKDAQTISISAEVIEKLWVKHEIKVLDLMTLCYEPKILNYEINHEKRTLQILTPAENQQGLGIRLHITWEGPVYSLVTAYFERL